MRHVFGISQHVRQLLDGAMDPPPEVFGSTTLEEHAAAGSSLKVSASPKLASTSQSSIFKPC